MGEECSTHCDNTGNLKVRGNFGNGGEAGIIIKKIRKQDVRMWTG